jgi:hypothetical protein
LPNGLAEKAEPEKELDMQGNQNDWRGALMIGAIGAICLCGPVAFGQTTGGESPTQESTKAEELLKRIQALEKKNQELEAENERLQDQLGAASGNEEAEPIDLREIAVDDQDYRFLSLGTRKDYLRAERFRIADQIESFIPPLYEPVRPFHAYTLPPGAWRIGLKGRGFRNDGDFGRDSNYAKLFRHVNVRSAEANLSIQYGFELPKFPDATLAVSIPYRSVDVSGAGHPFRIGALGITMDAGGQGLGDISVVLKKKWLDQGNTGFNFATFTGLILPTGKDDVEFEGAPTMSMFGLGLALPIPLNLFGRGFFDKNLPPGLQPGQGSLGFRVGGAVTRQFDRGALHAGAVIDFLMENDGIEPGDELKYGVSYVFPPFESDTVAMDLSVFGRYKWDSEFRGFGIMGPREDFKYGNVLFFSPSVILTPNPQFRFFVSPEIRILEPNRGPSPEWAVMLGTTYTF